MIKDQFTTILDNYLSEKKNSLKNNWIGSLIRTDLPSAINISASLGGNYIVQGSVGQGNWAEIPWICVFDKDITTSATKGYYIVYLFSSDMTGLYLSLNQGWTQYHNEYGTRKGRLHITQNANKFQEILRTTHDDFSFSFT